MKTYRVTLKATDANGNPLVVEVQGDQHKYLDPHTLSVLGEGDPLPVVAMFPAGEFVAIEISEGT